MNLFESYFFGFVRKFTAATVMALLLSCVAEATSIVGGASFAADLYQANVGEETFFAPGSYTFGAVSATLSGLSGGSLTAHAGVASAFSHDSIAYAFAVVGPQDGLSVPVWITYNLGVTAVGTNQGLPETGALASVAVSDASGLSLLFRVTAGKDALPNPTAASGTVPFTMVSGQVGDVLEVVRADGNSRAGEFADAFVDPFLFIDPGFLSNNPGYSVIVSAEIDNTPRGPAGVPEPATLALMGLGLIALAAVGLNRRTLIRDDL